MWDTEDGKLATNSDDDYEFSEVGGSWSFVPRGVPGAQQGSRSLSEKEELERIKMMRRKTILDFGGEFCFVFLIFFVSFLRGCWDSCDMFWILIPLFETL